MAEQERFTASLDKDLKKKLEEVAESNYRKLNGELNVAVEFYLKYGVTKVEFSEKKEEIIADKVTISESQEEIKEEVTEIKESVPAPPVVEKKNKTKLAPLG